MSDMSGFELFSQMMAQKQWSLLPRIIEQMSQQFSGHALGQKLMDMGTTLFRAGEYSQALTCYLQAEPHLVTLPGKININGLICSTYQRLKDLDVRTNRVVYRLIDKSTFEVSHKELSYSTICEV